MHSAGYAAEHLIASLSGPLGHLMTLPFGRAMLAALLLALGVTLIASVFVALTFACKVMQAGASLMAWSPSSTVSVQGGRSWTR